MLLNFVRLAGWQLCGVVINRAEIFWMGVFLGGTFPDGDSRGWSYLGWQFSS